MPPPLTSVDDVSEPVAARSFKHPARNPSATLASYLAEHRLTYRRLGVLAASPTDVHHDECDALLDQQQARIAAACSLQADSLEGVLTKLNLWYVDHLADGLDEPETETDALVASARADLRRLLTEAG